MLEQRLIQARIWLMRQSPFFATLLLNANVTITDAVGTMATDGRNLLINRDFSESLSDSELTGVLCHEVLHMALRHVSRGKYLPEPEGKESLKYYFVNYAADVIVNGVVAQLPKLALPEGSIRMIELENLSFDEVYSKIVQNPPFDIQKVNLCMGDGSGSDPEDDDQKPQGNGQNDDDDYWEEVLEQARIAEQMAGSTTSQVLKKLDGILAETTMDYRQALAQWLVPTRGSWGGYDRRFIYDDIYIDTNITEGLTLRVFIDTSGSVDLEMLKIFISEVKDNLAMSSWAEINVQGFFFDTELYGPYDSLDDLLNPKGFGGTDFSPIFKLIEEESLSTSVVNIIYTDGYASLEHQEPLQNTIWMLGGTSGITRKVQDFYDRGWQYVYKLTESSTYV